MKMVQLKNGTEEALPLVAVMVMTLRRLYKDHAIAFYELHEICKDHTHKPFGNAGEILRGLRLLEPDGKVHGSIRNIVLSAVSGEGFDLTLGSPVA